VPFPQLFESGAPTKLQWTIFDSEKVSVRQPRTRAVISARHS